MSAPESIFSITEIQGPTQNISAESLDNKTNEANAALFVSIMEQYAPPANSKMESWSARTRAATGVGTTETGKVLPAMPEVLPIVPDAALEEFAVDLGIDRSLARLLLRETAATSLDPEGREGDVAALTSGATPELIPALGVNASASTTPSVTDGDRPKASVASLAAMRETALGQRAATPGALGAMATASMGSAADLVELGAAMAAGESPLADEDVLRWRAAAARGGLPAGLSDAQRLETAFKPLGLEALRAPAASPESAMGLTTSSAATGATMPRAVPLSAVASSGQPLTAMASAAATSTATTLGDISAGASTVGALTATPPAASVDAATFSASAAGLATSIPTAPANVSILPAVGLVSKESGSKNTPRVDGLVAEQIVMESPADALELSSTGREMMGMSSNAWLALSATGLRRQGLAGAGTLESPSSAANSVAAASALTASPLAAGAPSALDPASAQARPIPLPSTALDYDTRAEQFAEQVGQRLVQQMRADRWTVSLQLDPRNLGPLDIALEIDGHDVRANLAVVNADVRALLEAGMPRLRETLELAGYQLSGWSMADSAGRDAAAQQFAQGFIERASRRSTAAIADEGIDQQGSRIVAEGNERGIDLYV